MSFVHVFGFFGRLQNYYGEEHANKIYVLIKEMTAKIALIKPVARVMLTVLFENKKLRRSAPVRKHKL